MMLELKDIHLHYGAIHALKGIRFHVNEGEIVTLIGSNGAGKSTTLMAISGVRRITEGRILLEGRSIHELKPDEIVRLGISQVPEGRRVFYRLTVAENLLMGAFLRHRDASVPSDVDHVFELFPILKERRSQKAGTLSGGEQQMLAIGRALMAKPRLLLLDEPSLGLAPILVERVFQKIIDINRSGVTILLVEQNAHQALQVANRGYILETGGISESSDAGDLLKNPDVRRAYLGED